MDLPTCPACRQSVLDDDVDECPFCGASMSGKPVTAKPSPKPAAVKSEPAAITPTAKAEQPAQSEFQTKPAPPAEDDPFELEKKAEVKSEMKAVRLRQKPEQGRSHKVVCPMCETPGYTARKAAGMLVRCANSECMMPVFTAPLLEKPSTSKIEESTRGSKILWISLVSFVVLGGASGLWYYGFFDGEKKIEPNPLSVKNNGGNRSNSNIKTTADPKKKKKTPVEKNKPIVSRSELRKTAIDRMELASRERNRNSNLALCQQYAALSYASLGKFTEAENQIKQLEVSSSGTPFYRVKPWLEIGWWHLNDSSSTGKDEARKTLEKAVQCLSGIPSRGPVRFEITVARAAFLYALGQKEQASELVAGFGPLGRDELLGYRKMAIEKSKSFDRGNDRFHTFSSIESDLLGAAVVLELFAHGKKDLALEWAIERTASRDLSDALVVWIDAERIQSNGPSMTPSDFMLKIQKLGSEHKTVALAHFACSVADGAEEFLKLAEEEFSKLPLPEPIKIVTFSDVFSSSRVRKQWYPKAAAAFQLAVARAVLSKEDASIISAFEKGMDYLRSATPNVAVIRQKLSEMKSGDSDKIRAEIAREFRLTVPSEIASRFRSYGRTLETLLQNADRRFRMQADVLTWLAMNAKKTRLEKIWNYIEQRRNEKDGNRKEDYFETSVPWIVAIVLESKNAEDVAKTIRSTLAEAKISQPENATLLIATLQNSDKIDLTAFAKTISSHNDALLQFDCTQIVAAKLVKAGKPDVAVSFVKKLDDEFLQLDLLLNIGGLCVRNGLTNEVSKFTQRRALPPAKMSALCRGIFLASQSDE